jgi:hypothetical protein
MKRRTVFAIVGWGVFALSLLSFIAYIVWQLKTGNLGGGYRTYKYQPMTYLGAAATLGIAALVGLVGLYYRLKRAYEDWRIARFQRRRAAR